MIGLHIVPFSEIQGWALSMAFFNSWDFAAHYVPAELEARGVASLPPRVYPYGQTSSAVWEATRKYVANVVASAGSTAGGAPGASLIERDERVAAWVAQLREPGWIPSFPDIRTDAALVDA